MLKCTQYLFDRIGTGPYASKLCIWFGGMRKRGQGKRDTNPKSFGICTESSSRAAHIVSLNIDHNISLSLTHSLFSWWMRKTDTRQLTLWIEKWEHVHDLYNCKTNSVSDDQNWKQNSWHCCDPAANRRRPTERHMSCIRTPTTKRARGTFSKPNWLQLKWWDVIPLVSRIGSECDALHK